MVHGFPALTAAPAAGQDRIRLTARLYERTGSRCASTRRSRSIVQADGALGRSDESAIRSPSRSRYVTTERIAVSSNNFRSICIHCRRNG